MVALNGEPGRGRTEHALKLRRAAKEAQREEEEEKKFNRVRRTIKPGPRRAYDTERYHGLYAPHFTAEMSVIARMVSGAARRTKPAETT